MSAMHAGEIFRFLAACAAFLCLTQIVYAASVAYLHPKPLGIPVHLVVVNLNDPTILVTINLSDDRLAKSESFERLIRKSSPTAAVTGTYFDTRSLLPVGDLVINGRYIYSGSVRTALAISSDNKAEFTTLPRPAPKWAGFETVLCSGPRLVNNGSISLSPKSEGFRDPRVFAVRPRTAIGLTKHRKLLLVATGHPLRLRTLAKVMLALGAENAMALDGGSSTAMYYKGKFVMRPSRRLTNVVSVYAGYKLAKNPPKPVEKVPSNPVKLKDAYVPEAVEEKRMANETAIQTQQIGIKKRSKEVIMTTIA